MGHHDEEQHDADTRSSETLGVGWPFAGPSGASVPAARGQTPLPQGFQQPPAATRPWCYWYWISDNISREGLTRDLEAMASAGIGEALVGNVFFDDTAPEM